MSDLDIRYKALVIWKAIPDKFDFSEAIFNEIQKKYSLEIATRVLYLYLKNKVSNIELDRYISDHSQDLNIENVKNKKVIVLVHQPWWSLPENTEYQFALKGVFGEQGYDVTFPEIGYRKSIFENAREYSKILSMYEHKDVFVVTYGLASLELRYLLTNRAGELPYIKGWLNLSGLIYGTRQTSINGPVGSFLRYWNDNYNVPESIYRKQGYCSESYKFSGVPNISVVGLPARYTKKHELDVHGPHDNYISLLDFVNHRDRVLPLWNASHNFDPRMYKNPLLACLQSLVLGDREGKGEYFESSLSADVDFIERNEEVGELR